MLGQADGGAVWEGIGPGAEPSLAALGHDSCFNLLHDRREVALFGLEVDAERARVAEQRRRQTGFDEEAAEFHDLTDQRFGVCVVGRVEGGVLAVFLDPLRHVFEHELLCADDADVAQRIGRGLEDELDAEVLTRLFEDHAPTGQRLDAHVAREGDMHEGLRPELLGGPDHAVAGGDEVVAHDQVGDLADDQRIFLRHAAEQEDVGTHLTHAAEAFGGARHGLVHHDRLHQRIVGQRNDLRDRRFLFGAEVVGVRQVLDHPAVLDVAVFLDHGFGAADFVFALVHGTRDNSDVIFGGSQRRRSRNCQAQSQREMRHTLTYVHHKTSLKCPSENG